jgi:hypothetical protein
VPFDGTIVSAVGHLHPGGLYDTIELARRGASLPKARTCRREALDIGDTRSASTCVRATAGAVPNSVRIFRSHAHYYEPAGPVSWDVALTASRPDWRVRVRKGDTLSAARRKFGRVGGVGDGLTNVMPWDGWLQRLSLSRMFVVSLSVGRAV